MSSGIAVDDACLNAFQDLKLKKSSRYIIYTLNKDNTSIIIENEAGKDATYDDFLSALPEDDCRYAVFDYEYKKGDDQCMRSKICFIVWSPDCAKIKQKMLYASSKDALRKKLVGIGAEIQATDSSEVSEDAIKEKVCSI